MIRAAGIVFKCGNRVLMLKRDDGTWAWPGGKLEQGESFKDAAVRELHEECGAVLHRPEHLSRLDTSFGDVNYVTYLGHIDLPFAPKLNEEHSEHKWVHLNKLPTPLHPGVDQTIAKLRSR